jgi:FkbM family methyltransferase
MGIIKSVARELTPPLLQKLYRSLRGRERKIFRESKFYHEAEHRALNEGCEPNRIVMRPGIELCISPETVFCFEFFCFRDEEMVKEFDCFLELSGPRKNLLDVGAMHGSFALAFTARGGGTRALAIEPSPVAFAKLLYNRYKNPSCDVKCLEVALSDRDGSIPMYQWWEHLRVSSDPSDNRACLRVPARTGDSVCLEVRFEPDLMKIDVEGYELRCLTGLQKTISAFRPVICLELHPKMLGAYHDSAADLAGFFEKMGYSFYSLEKGPLKSAEVGRLTEIRRIVAAPAETRI